MALENSILLENVTVVNGSVSLYDNESVNESMMIENNNVEENENPENDRLTDNNVEENGNPENDLLKGNNVEENENPENDLLKGLDSYMDDINDRLTVSRMVNDSVIKGMVSAIEQVSAEEIADKELELSRLKETLHLYLVGSEEGELSRPLVMQHELGTAKCGRYSSMSDALSDCERIGESLGSLKNVAKDQLKNLRKDIEGIKGSCSMRRIGSGSEMVGLDGILQHKESDIKWMDVDKTLDSLRATLGTICKHVDNLVCSSNASLCQWQQEKLFRAEIEDMVIMNCIRSLKEEFEERLWDESLNRLEKIKEISSLCQELSAVSKLLSVPEMGPTTSHGSVEIGEEGDTNKRTDHLHSKISGNHASLSTSLLEGSGKHDETVIATPENLDFNQLKHMTKEELVNYFKSEMTKMKRNHEHKVQELTEQLFSLKGAYLRERESCLLLKKDKELDILRKNIPEVILKLGGILVENQKLPGYGMDAAGLSSLKDRLESLHRENRQLRSLLADRKREVKCLSSQASDAAEMTLQHSLVKATLEKRIDNLICALDDTHIAASITEDVYICLLKEVVDCQKSSHEKSDMEYKIMQEVYEIIFREAADLTEPSTKCGFEDSDLESLIMQELCGVISAEALKEAEVELNELSLAYSNEMELRVSVEKEAMERERALRLEVAEMEGLKQETLLLPSLMEEKEKLANEAAAALVKEKEHFELVSQELNNLRDETSRQQILISARNKEFGEMKDYLVKALVENELYKMEVYELKQELELAVKELRETNEEKRMLLSVSQQKQHVISLAEAKEREQSKQMQSLIVLIQGLSKAIDNFECRVMEDIKRSNSRLDGLSSQSRAVIQQAKDIKRMGLIYKQKLEKRSSDLQKAEAEVDLLGDEVDALLSLLEKIYIALDHYSPILQHYPGVIEILNLVKRELSGEFTKMV